MVYSIGAALVALPCLAAGYAATKATVHWGGTIAMFMCSLSFFYFCVVFFINSSDLIVDEAGLARQIFGLVCMRASWTGIKVIRERFFPNNQFGGQIRIDVIPRNLHGIALGFPRIIKVSDQLESFDELVNLLNEKSEKYAIRLELEINGIWKPQSKLVAALPTRSANSP